MVGPQRKITQADYQSPASLQNQDTPAQPIGNVGSSAAPAKRDPPGSKFFLHRMVANRI